MRRPIIVYGIISDYRNGHPQILPAQFNKPVRRRERIRRRHGHRQVFGGGDGTEDRFSCCRVRAAAGAHVAGRAQRSAERLGHPPSPLIRARPAAEVGRPDFVRASGSPRHPSVRSAVRHQESHERDVRGKESRCWRQSPRRRSGSPVIKLVASDQIELCVRFCATCLCGECEVVMGAPPKASCRKGGRLRSTLSATSKH